MPTLKRTKLQMFSAVPACGTREEAQKLVREEIASMIADHGSLMEDQARKLLLDDIGYIAAYFDRSTAARVLHLFEVEHPKYGSIENWPAETDALWDTARSAARRDFEAIHGGALGLTQ